MYIIIIININIVCVFCFSDMEEKILKENPFAELKTEIDIINGTHSFASSVLTENNDLEFVFNMRADIKQKPQKCNICNKWFSKESTFQIHMKYHNILKKSLNKCSSCGCSDVFFYQQELTEKNSNTPFKCRVCQILF